MSQGLNKITLVGNLGKDPEVRFAQTGTAICSLSVAVGERRKEGEGWVDHTEWFKVVCFGKTAENAGQYLQKGRQVVVEGRGQHTKWTDKDGKERYGFEVVADRLIFIGGKGDDAGQAAKPASSPKAQQTSRPPARSQPLADDQPLDDLPF